MKKFGAILLLAGFLAMILPQAVSAYEVYRYGCKYCGAVIKTSSTTNPSDTGYATGCPNGPGPKGYHAWMYIPEGARWVKESDGWHIHSY